MERSAIVSIFENHVYPSKKILCLPKFFAFFGAKIGALSISLTTWEFCPTFLPFLEPKSEHFYHLPQKNFAQFFCLFWSQNQSTFYITYYIGILPKFFAFFGAKIGALTTEEFCPNFLPFLEPKLEHFLLLTIPYFAQIFAIFGAKIRALSTAD